MNRPILYSFRRCPYAMRARLAIQSARIDVELREIVLRDKAPEFLAASPKGTVPVVVDGEQVIEESFDVMLWALNQHDPHQWLNMPAQGYDWISRCDGPFKHNLDLTKYANRHPDRDPNESRDAASEFLMDLDLALENRTWLFGESETLADMAMLPFIRQFANIDRSWFDAQNWPNLAKWLDRFLESDQFLNIMTKHAKWEAGHTPIDFP